MGVTPVYALPFPELTDDPNGPEDMHALALAVEDVLANGLKKSWEKIASGAIGATTAFDISSIPLTYDHLRLTVRVRAGVAGGPTGLYLRFQGDASAAYDYQYQEATGATHAAAFFDNAQSMMMGYVGRSIDPLGVSEIIIPNYRVAANRVVLGKWGYITGSNDALTRVGHSVGLWPNPFADALNQINLLSGLAFDAAKSTFLLEGRVG